MFDRKRNISLRCVTVSAKGPRPYMEDTYVAEGIGKFSVVLGVFDGHGGSEVSDMCAKETPNIIKDVLQYDHHDGAIALRRLYTMLDYKALSSFHGRVGATAAVVLVKNEWIICSNCGDSLIMLKTKSGELRMMSQDHKVQNEKERVIKSGGNITYDDGCARINQGLNIARSIGDGYVKNIVISDPYISAFQRVRTPVAWILVASDGLWDVFDMAGIDKELTQSFSLGKNQAEAVQALLTEAYRRGSRDNITIVFGEFDYNFCS